MQPRDFGQVSVVLSFEIGFRYSDQNHGSSPPEERIETLHPQHHRNHSSKVMYIYIMIVYTQTVHG